MKRSGSQVRRWASLDSFRLVGCRHSRRSRRHRLIYRQGIDRFRKYSSRFGCIKKQLPLFSDIPWRTEELEHLMLEAIQQLQQVGQVVTVNTIARIVHVTPYALKRYPRIKAVLEADFSNRTLPNS